MDRYPPQAANIADAALLEGAAAALRRAWLDLEERAKGGATAYADEAFSEALVHLEEAAAALSAAARKAEENAIEDAVGEAADRAYDEQRDD